MARTFLIQDLDNFSNTDKNNLKELIAISLRARELQLALLGLKDENKPETNELHDEKPSESSTNFFSKDFEITSNKDDLSVELIEQAIPKVADFLAVRSRIIPTLRKLTSNCEDACNNTISDPQQREECKKTCHQVNSDLLANILSLAYLG